MPVLMAGGHKGQFIDPKQAAVRAQRLPASRNQFLGQHGRKGRRIIGKSLVFPAVRPDLPQIAVPDQKSLRHHSLLGLAQQRAILGDQALSGENQVLGALPRSRGGVGIDRGCSGGLMPDKVLAIGPLSNGLVGSGEIHDHLCTAEGQNGGRRHRCPQVLADLHAKLHSLPQQEQGFGGNRSLDTSPARQFQNRRICTKLVPGSKPTFFVKFIVVGQIGFWHQAQQYPCGQHRRTIIKFPV